MLRIPIGVRRSSGKAGIGIPEAFGTQAVKIKQKGCSMQSFLSTLRRDVVEELGTPFLEVEQKSLVYLQLFRFPI